MDKKSLQDNLRLIFREILKIKTDRGHLEVKLNQYQYWDSLTHLRLIVEVEKKFKIKIPGHKVQKLDSFNKFLEILD